LSTHLTEILKDNMADLLSYAEVQKLLKDLPGEQKKLVDDLVPSIVTASTLQRVLQHLLKERVWGAFSPTPSKMVGRSRID
ncbi:FHIPEP family type III secretion protein, partial [Streptococcus pyogenes]